ncbi:MAG TPA: HAMP domain-containing sensor histidine kinase [Actinomycetes bacterium]|nr:HAMP domain-containing sensor histidine kinase [Actinomycetes bacterium]
MVFTTLLIAGEFFPIRIRHRDQTKALLVTAPFAFVLVPVAGVGVAVLANMMAAVVPHLVRRKPFIKLAFNAAQYVLAIAAGGLVYVAAGGGPEITARTLPAFVAGAAVLTVFNHLLVNVAVSLAAGTPLRAGLTANLRLELISSALLLSLAPVAVIIAQHALFLVPALVSPLVAVYLASKGWVEAEAAADRQRRLTEREQEVVRRLQEADRMKADLLATVTHELRSPLTTILGALQLLRLREGRIDPGARQEFVTMGMRQGERLQRMIEQLLLAAEFEQRPAKKAALNGGRVKLDASELIRRAGAEAQARHNQRPIVVDTNGSLLVLATQDAVAQVLDNLIDNACKYSPDGQPVRLSGTRENGHAVLAVEDCGPGVDPAERDRIFERFTQLDGQGDRRGGGVGLGLYIARELARGQGGDLVVTDSASSTGARFELRLPLVASHEG